MWSLRTIGLCLIALIYCACRGEGQKSASNATQLLEKINKTAGVPKCCEMDEALVQESKSCAKTNLTVNYEHNYFNSNATHIDDEYVKFVPTIFYKQLLVCPPELTRVLIYHDEVLGFIYNFSILVYPELVPPTKYCVDSFDERIAFLMCFQYEQPLQAQVPFVCYLSFLIISTLCCFGTAVVYPYMMKLKEVHKKCFVGYSFSTGFAILFEIILQTEVARGGCNILGALFFFFTITSYVWLACLCLDLIVRLRTLGGKGNENRFYLYIASSLAVPSVVSLATLLANANKPAVPDSFIKPSDGDSVCKFEGELALFFVPVGLLVLASLGFLAYFFYLRRQNEKYHKNKHDWVIHRSKFNYMFSQCLTLFMIRLTFFVVELIHTFLDASLVETSPVTVLKIISSLEGFFILLVFVVHCLKKKQWRKERIDRGDNPTDQRLMRNFLEY